MRYIDADELMREVEKAENSMEYYGQEFSYSFLSSGQEISTEWYFVENLIESSPTADVRENVKGKWIPVTNGRGGSECNQCHAYAPTYKNGTEYNSNFCPNCGADMRGEK